MVVVETPSYGSMERVKHRDAPWALVHGNKPTRRSDGSYDPYLGAMGFGVLRGALRMPLEHPLDVVKTYWQGDPSINGPRQAMRRVYSMYGWRGFYAGGTPSTIRYTTKELYRWPMIFYLPPYFERILNRLLPWRSPQGNNGIAQCLAGLTVANMECIVTCPLEVLKVQLITRNSMSTKSVLSSLLSRGASSSSTSNLASPSIGISPLCVAKPICTGETHNTPATATTTATSEKMGSRNSALQGLRAYYIRQNISWVSFLYFNDFFKKRARARSGTPQGEKLSPMWLMGVAAQVGAINTILILPLDCIKTQMQLGKSSTNIGSLPTQQSGLSVMKQPRASAVCASSRGCVECGRRLLSAYGVRGLFIGLHLRLAQYIVNSFLTVTILEHLHHFHISAVRNNSAL